MESFAHRGRREDDVRVLYMSTFVPRACGIATYTDDLLRAAEPHGMDSRVLAMEQAGQPLPYGDRVVGTVLDDTGQSYREATELVNGGAFDVLALQHEFGIYGGDNCDHLPAFLRAVRIPVVVTFHTIVPHPHERMRAIQQAIGTYARGVVVMNGLAINVLDRVYGIDPRKIAVMHHGAPVPHCARRSCTNPDFTMPGNPVITTFGLMHPGKGVEYMIQAMPRILARYPEAVYYILGRTHPVIVRQAGERYRGMLENLAVDLGILDHVRFVNRYLEKSEIVEYLLQTDLYVNPYVSTEQITSGTLAYAIGAGCPVISTPYLHARYLVTEDRGVLVAPREANELAGAVEYLMGTDGLRERMEEQNWAFGQHLYWPRVGRDYADILRDAVA